MNCATSFTAPGSGQSALTSGGVRIGPASQDDGGVHSGGPGAKILRTELVAHHTFDVVIQIGSSHIAPDSRLLPGQQILGRPTAPAQGTDHLCHVGIMDNNGAVNAPFGGIAEPQLPSVHLDVLTEQCGHSKGLMRLGVLLATDPESPDIEQAHTRSQDPRPRKSLGRQVCGHLLAQRRQSSPKGNAPDELLAIPTLAPAFVIQVLPTSRGIRARGLDVAVFTRADPHIHPGRWDGQREDPALGVHIGHPLPVRP
jgi:hypothetical protein